MLAGLDREERLGLAGKGAAGEGDADGAHAVVGVAGVAFDGGEVVAAGRACAGGLEDIKPAGDAAPAVGLGRWRREHVVGDEHGAAVDAVGAQPLLGHAEVEHVAAVVAEGEEHTGAAVSRLGNPVRLLARWTGEDVTDHRRRRHAGADQAVEGGIMAGTAADDHRDVARRRCAGGDHAGCARDSPQIRP